jgi:hypothetical protein
MRRDSTGAPRADAGCEYLGHRLAWLLGPMAVRTTCERGGAIAPALSRLVDNRWSDPSPRDELTSTRAIERPKRASHWRNRRLARGGFRQRVAGPTRNAGSHARSRNFHGPLGRAIVESVAIRSDIPALHEHLVRELASLRDAERRVVIAAAEQAARESRGHAVASWRSIRAALGVVKGEPANAVDDSARLCDG